MMFMQYGESIMTKMDHVMMMMICVRSKSLTLPQSFRTKFLADVYTARQYIFGFGLGLSFFISFLYISILRLPYLLNAIIWGSIFGVIILTFAAGGYSLYSANSWATEVPQIWSDRSITATRIAGYVLFGLGAFFVLLMCCLRKQIQLAIGCVKETGKAVQRMVFIIFLPVLQGAGFVLFMLAFVVYGIYLASLGTLETTEFPLNLQGLTITVRSYNFADWVTRAAWYLLFCLYWTANFIVAAGDMMVAMSIAKWYFTRNKRKTGNSTVIKSVCDTLYFHSGTLAFGSLLVAIIQLIRTLLARVQREVKKANSKIADCLLCCCQCCLWCFEKCIKFINKNAYIQTAIFGTSFCVSARHAFFLILRNIGRIGAVSYVSGAVLVMGKLFISGITTVVTYYLMSELLGGELFSVAGPTILVFIMSYVIADMFLDVFELGISTILHCFVADEEMFDGEECFAEGDLQDWINKYEENFNK
jgi:choline transporter-like protein 2/4/5